MGNRKTRKHRGATARKHIQTGMKVTTTPGQKFLQQEAPPKKEAGNLLPTQKIVKIEKDRIRESLRELCEKLSTDEITVEFTEDVRKLDAGMMTYIIHVGKPDAPRRTPTRKTGMYFTKVKDCIHVQVVNGISMVSLFSNYSDNSQTEVFRYLENILKRDIEFYQNTLEARKSAPPRRKERKSQNHGRKEN